MHFLHTAVGLLAAATSTANALSLLPQFGNVTAQDIINELELIPNVEGGYYVESFRDTAMCGNRSASTAIYYLLEGSFGPSLWHRVTDAAEVWHYYAGAPMAMSLSGNNGSGTSVELLGPDVLAKGAAEQRPQVMIPANMWQSARALGEWSLVGTTVAPAFSTDGYEVAEPGWEPE